VTTVLVVDDSPITLAMVRTLLRRHGYDTVETRSAPGALALLTGARPSLVVADLKMPGMNGYELAQAIRSDPELADVPIVFYTAYYEAAQDCAGAVEVADSRIVPKSGESHLLVDAVADALRA
jgi:CheY-like chemotaxis protein